MCLLNMVTFHYCVTNWDLQAAESLSSPGLASLSTLCPWWCDDCFTAWPPLSVSVFSGGLCEPSPFLPLEFLPLVRLWYLLGKNDLCSAGS